MVESVTRRVLAVGLLIALTGCAGNAGSPGAAGSGAPSSAPSVAARPPYASTAPAPRQQGGGGGDAT